MKNLGILDRIIRLIIGLVLIYIAYTLFASSLVWSVILFVVGIGFIITTITGFCILYKLLGITTAKSNLPMNPPSTPSQPQQPQGPGQV